MASGLHDNSLPGPETPHPHTHTHTHSHILPGKQLLSPDSCASKETLECGVSRAKHLQPLSGGRRRGRRPPWLHSDRREILHTSLPVLLLLRTHAPSLVHAWKKKTKHTHSEDRPPERNAASLVDLQAFCVCFLFVFFSLPTRARPRVDPSAAESFRLSRGASIDEQRADGHRLRACRCRR